MPVYVMAVEAECPEEAIAKLMREVALAKGWTILTPPFLADADAVGVMRVLERQATQLRHRLVG